jgi:hypothetical protein
VRQSARAQSAQAGATAGLLLLTSGRIERFASRQWSALEDTIGLGPAGPPRRYACV